MQYCGKCGMEMAEGSSFCPKCGAGGHLSQEPASFNGRIAAAKPQMNVVSIVCFAVAGLVLLFSLIACFKIMGGAGDMADLRSVGGGTVSEAYYNYCGAVYGGIGLFALAFGLFASGLLAYFGFTHMKK